MTLKKVFAAFSIIILLDLVWLWLVFTNAPDPTSSLEIHFIVEKGENANQIAQRLYAENLIRSASLFRAYTVLGGISNNLKTGEYTLRPSMRMPEIVLRFANGDFIEQELRILEGWSLKTIAEDLKDQELFSQEDFYYVVGAPGIDYRNDDTAPTPYDFSEEFTFLKEKPEYVSLEGYLFPDTYHIAKGDSPEDIVRRALHNFEEKITPELLEQIHTQEKTLFEILTMASIIEKEVRSLEDKKIVSGILWKRLADGMRLQVDATVVYIREGNYYKVKISETKTDSPYNTYRNDGLPPGPISNPGLESIEAALNPKESPYWFYLSPNINTTVFSKTFEQHKAAADLYIR
jgi:UPF0755 protein